MNPTIEEAAKVLADVIGPGSLSVRLAKDLHTAGLLASAELRACGEAAKMYAKKFDMERWVSPPPEVFAMREAGRALLASERKPDRYVVEDCGRSCRVRDSLLCNRVESEFYGARRESDAKERAERLNREEE